MNNTKRTNNFFTSLFLALTLGLGVFLISTSFAFAASMSLSPSSVTRTVGDRFSINIITSSPTQSMNAISADLSFSTDTLELVSLSKSTSIIDFWAQEPSFNNQAGTAFFEGVVFGGYTGSAGNIATLTFRAKRAGTARISFSSADILANDGSGTSILSGLGSATVIINNRVAPPPPPPAPDPEPKEENLKEVDGPTALISSPTHPVQDKWYKSNDPTFRWGLSNDVTDVDFVISTSLVPEYEEGTSKGRVDHVSLSDLPDGTHFLHVVLKTEDEWGPSTSFQFNIDTQPPEYLLIQEVYRSLADDQRASFLFDAKDLSSGVKLYRIAIDGKYIEDWKDDGTHTYQTPELDAGVHNMVVQVVDHANNTLEQEFVFNITGIEKTIDLRDYIELGIIFLLLILIIILLIRYARVIHAYKQLLEVKGIGVVDDHKTRRRRQLEKEVENVQRLQQDLSNIEAKIQRELHDFDQ